MSHSARPPRVVRHADIDSNKLRLARRFRQAPPAAEATAWQILRDRAIFGLTFRRQQLIAGFIVDFYCPAQRLVLELPGGAHDDPTQRERDLDRSQILSLDSSRSGSCVFPTATSTSRLYELCWSPMHDRNGRDDGGPLPFPPAPPLSLARHPRQRALGKQRAGPGRGGQGGEVCGKAEGSHTGRPPHPAGAGYLDGNLSPIRALAATPASSRGIRDRPGLQG